MTMRQCILHESIAVEMNHEEQPHTCSRYKPQKKRFLAMLGLVEDKGRFRDDFEVYRPVVDSSPGRAFTGSEPPVVDGTAVSLDAAEPPTVESVIEGNLEDFRAEVERKLAEAIKEKEEGSK